MEYQSILGLEKLKEMQPEDILMPKFFYDLNLDQVVQEIMEEQNTYDLRRFYYFTVKKEDIYYRLEVLKDLENEKLFRGLIEFSKTFQNLKEYINYREETKDPIQKQKWKLDGAYLYIKGVEQLYHNLSQEKPNSDGLRLFMSWLNTYLNTKEFLVLQEETTHLIHEFDQMKFNLEIKKDRVVINPEYIEDDYGKKLMEIFGVPYEEEHFYQINPFVNNELCSLEEEVLTILKKQYSNTFKELSEYDKKIQDFINETIKEFDHEIQFYLAFCSYRNKMMELNFHFSYPKVQEKDDFYILDSYDLALARKNSVKKKEVVYNDCNFDNEERFLVITGPNQGGKTTFGRAIGQILYFASIGLMVPAKVATIPMFSGIYTHFAVEENLDSGAGKLKEELVRLKEMMNQDIKRCFVIFNEIFTSATSYDAFIMGKRVIDHFINMGCMGIYITHIHELTKEDSRVGSLVASLLNEESNIRTFKIKRKQADGRSYANTIVSKYHLTYHEIKERMK